MLEQDAAEPRVSREHFGSREVRSGARTWASTDIPIIGGGVTGESGGDLWIGPGFLSESDAAMYLGMSTAQLVGLRKFDLAMIEKGFKPHGPPPLWRGGVCTYARENLDEWARSQSARYPKLRSSIRQEAA